MEGKEEEADEEVGSASPGPVRALGGWAPQAEWALSRDPCGLLRCLTAQRLPRMQFTLCQRRLIT